MKVAFATQDLKRVDAHFGWDYNPEKMHLVDSKALYTWLLNKGFKSPVSSWDKYTRTSGALSKTINANGKNVKVEVRSEHGPARTLPVLSFPGYAAATGASNPASRETPSRISSGDT